MARVKVFGAGSIGNHLGHACRGLGWAVTLCDIDAPARRRTRDAIYPARYGAWDDEIRLAAVDEMAKEPFDVVIVGTPPDTHIPIAIEQLEAAAPAVLFIEKPLCPPDLDCCDALQRAAANTGTFVGVGYNHTLTRNTVLAERWLAANPIGEPLTLQAMTREHWGGSFRAHPWLAGPHDT